MKPSKLVLLFVATLGAGCGESIYTDALQSAPLVPHFTFSLTFPPKAFLRSDTNIIIIINRVDLNKKQLPASDVETAKAGAYTALKYAGEQLAQLPHVRVINITDSLNFAINTDSVARLAARYHTDYTLALARYQDTVSFVSTYRKRDYYDNKVDLKFTMYLGEGDLYKELHGSDTLRSFWRERDIAAAERTYQKVDLSKDFIISATQSAVLNALADYLPYTETESRPLYAGGKLSPAADAIMNRQFDKARRLSQPFLNDRDAAVVCQAAYNMAVIYEAQGDLDKATSMAQLSLAKSKNVYANSLLTYLKSK